MRVLFTSVSALGHVHPMVPLARALLDRGHLVRWLTGPDACGRLRAVGIEADPAGIPFEALRAEYRARYPDALSLPRPQVPDHVFPHLFGEVATPWILPEAIRIARSWRPDLLINDAADFAGPIAAALTGIPSVTHAFGALTPIHRVEAAARHVASLWRSVGLTPRPFGGLYDHLYLDIYPPSLQVADMGHVPRRQLLRPEAFDDAADTSSFAWPDGHSAAAGSDPLEYLTFGTVDRDRPGLRTALEAVALHPVRLLVTVGPTGDPSAFGPQPAHVRVERYVPQTRLLAHCDLVVSHAGSGTFLATLANGVPQLCLPQGADQFLNAFACLRARAGLILEPPDATAAAIGDAVGRLLAEPAYRAAAGEVAVEIAAMPGPDAVAAVLESLAISA